MAEHTSHSDDRGDSGIRHYQSQRRGTTNRSPLVNMVILMGLIGLTLFLIYLFAFPTDRLQSQVVDLNKSIEHIRELSTVKSHLRFNVIVREESGNIIVRKLADQPDKIAMKDLSAMLFHDPTLIAELHAVITYGVRLENIENQITQDENNVYVNLTPATILDVNVIDGDTRIVAQMEGLFRSPNHELLLAASQRGESFARSHAESDTITQNLATLRAQEVIAIFVEQENKKAIFTEKNRP